MTHRGRLTLALGCVAVRRRVAAGRAGAVPGRRSGWPPPRSVAALWVRAARRPAAVTRRPAATCSSRATTSRVELRAELTRGAPARGRSRSPSSSAGSASTGSRSRRTAASPPAASRCGASRAAATPSTGATAYGRGPVRARARRARRSRKAARCSCTRGSSSSAALFTENGPLGARRPAAAPAPAERLRLPRRARAPAGRVAAPRALALDGQARRADGQGLRGRAARRACDRARRRRRPVAGPSFDVQVRAAGSLLRRIRARGGRTALLAINRAQPEYHHVASERRLAGGLRRAGRRRAGRRRRRSLRCSRRRRARSRGSASSCVVTAASRAPSPTGSSSARRPAAGAALVLVDAPLVRRAQRLPTRRSAAPLRGGRGRHRRRGAATTWPRALSGARRSGWLPVRRTLLVWPLPAAVIALACWLRLEHPRTGNGACRRPARARPCSRRSRAGARSTAAARSRSPRRSPRAAVAADAVAPSTRRSSRHDRADAGLRELLRPRPPVRPAPAPARCTRSSSSPSSCSRWCSPSTVAAPAAGGCLRRARDRRGWPSALLGGSGDAHARRRDPRRVPAPPRRAAARRPARAPGARRRRAARAAALAASTSAAVARGRRRRLAELEPVHGRAQRVSVDYVWRSQYRGHPVPEPADDRLRGAGARTTARYWRATTLDASRGRLGRVAHGHIAHPEARAASCSRTTRRCPRARDDRRTWLDQRFFVERAADDHLPAAATPVAYASGDAPQLYSEGGVAIRPGGLQRGDSYTVWSYAARPKPKALARLGADYPHSPSSRSDLTSGAARRVPTVRHPRARGRDRRACSRPTRPRRLRAALPHGAARRRQRARPRTRAAVALETWFRIERRLHLRRAAAAGAGVPPLVGFVTQTRAGYCQHFAGAMALMLRYLGDPGARRGRLHERPLEPRLGERWIVSDTDAHAWVEVWFPGYGWLPFDPTPSRGSFDAPVLGRVRVVRRGRRGDGARGRAAGSGSQALLRLARQRNRPPAAGGVDRPAAASAGGAAGFA